MSKVADKGDLDSAHAEKHHFQSQNLVWAVDVALASAAVTGSVWLLTALESLLGVKLYAPPLTASAILIFSSLKPPPAMNVFGGTAGATVMALLLLKLESQHKAFVRSVAVGAALVWFKTSSRFFPPAAALAALVHDNAQLATSGWTYLVFPCLAGNAILYAIALALGEVRQHVRVVLTRRQWDLSGESPEKLREIFDRYDTSGDGQIDANELQIALRAVTGSDVSLEDCSALVREADSDGNGTIDFHEFVQVFKYQNQNRKQSAATTGKKK